MKKINFKKLIAGILCMAVLMIMPLQLPSAVSAAESSNRKGSLSIFFHHEDRAISDAVFSIYRIANIKQDGSYALTGKYADYSVSLENLDVEGMNTLASTLWAYTARDSVTPDAQGKTNEYGGLKFSNLSRGLYLVIGDVFKEGNVIYTPQPFLVSIPSENKIGQSEYDITAEPKYDRMEDSEGKVVERKALKIWKNDKSKEKRPKKVVVQLLRNGEIFDEAVLNEKNNWRYTWSDLDASYNWLLTEKTVADDYTVAIERQGITFTVTNTYHGKDNRTPDSASKKDKLPKTGQLWWPVFVLAFAGILLLVFGIKRRRRSIRTND